MSLPGHIHAMLTSVARALGEDYRARMVFVGGCTTALFVTDPVTRAEVRATDDVDLIVDLAGYVSWVDLQAQLRTRGFVEAMDEHVICRMRLGPLKVDFMPDDPEVLGFSNRWYSDGLKMANFYVLEPDLVIRILTPPLFIATKLEAFWGRGHNDLFSSRDLEDVLLVLDGRSEIVEDIRNCNPLVREYISTRFQILSMHRDFDDFLEGNIRGSRGRAELVSARLHSIINI